MYAESSDPGSVRGEKKQTQERKKKYKVTYKRKYPM